MRQQNQFCVQLDAGNVVYFDIRRILHSSKGFRDLNRHLQICKLSRENLHQRVRLSARQQVFIDEANQYTGVSG